MKASLFGALALLVIPFISLASYGSPTGIAPIVGTVATSTPPRVTVPVTLPSVIVPSTSGPQEAGTDYLLKIEGVDGESSEKKGEAEMSRKVEEGSKNPGVEPDEIDYNGDSERTTNFAILLGGPSGGSDEEDEEGKMKGLELARQVLEENAKASDQAIKSISLNFEKITTRVKHEVKLFGFIPVTAVADVEIDANEDVEVKFPWWAFLATGKDSEGLGERIFMTLSEVLETKHDRIKNAVQNAR